MDSGLLFLLIFINLALSGLVAYVAVEKGRSGATFFLLSFFLSFIVGILVVIALPSENPITENREGSNWEVDCAFCKEKIKSTAVVCKHCGRDVEPQYEKLKAEKAAASQKALLREKRAEAARINLLERQAQERLDKWNRIKKPVIVFSVLSALIILTISISITISNEQVKAQAKAELAQTKELERQESKKNT